MQCRRGAYGVADAFIPFTWNSGGSMRMLRRLGLLSLAVGFAVAACGDDPVTPAAEVYRATMNGANESPPVTTNATGTGTFTVTGNNIAYNITISNWPANSTLSGAHIHFAPAAGQTTGGVMVPFPTTGTGAITTQGGSGTVAVTAEQLGLIRAGGTYFNVHSTAAAGSGGINAPGGLIRGNLVRQ
jgi:hypothetical protein